MPSAAEIEQRAHEAETVEFVTGLLGAPDDDDPTGHRGLLARSAKLAGLALGSLALCGSMVAASSLNHHRTPTAAPKPATTTVLTGVGVLRPDTVAAQLSGGHIDSTTPAPQTATMAGGRALGTIVGKPPQPPAAAPPVHKPADTPLTAAAVVQAFYRLVRTDPGRATTLIDPSLLATDMTGFNEAWSSVSQIDIESVQPVSVDSVQAVIRMRQPDGSWIRAVALLHVTESNNPLINGAQLLSAQHG